LSIVEFRIRKKGEKKIRKGRDSKFSTGAEEKHRVLVPSGGKGLPKKKRISRKEEKQKDNFSVESGNIPQA